MNSLSSEARKRRSRILAPALAATLALGLLKAPAADSRGAATSARARSDAAERIFATDDVPRISVEIARAELDRLSRYRWDPGTPAADRISVPATVREGATTWTNVAVHLKGAAGSFRPLDDRPALTLNFDKLAPGHAFHGLRKLSLNNSVQDPTYVSEIVCRELYRKAGVPVPRATHARVELNGRDLGLYVLVEGWDRDFLRRNFVKSSGHLYDGGFVKDITEELALNVGDDRKDQSDRLALLGATEERDPAKRLTRLERVLDVDRFLSLVALDVLAWNWDGYALNRNNWRLYHDVSRNRMVFMPHGLDQMFWKPEGSILPPMEGLVARAALQVPELRRRYFDRLRDLRRTAFDVASLTNRVAHLAARARGALAETGASEAERREHERLANEFARAIARRAVSVDTQLRDPIEPAQFDATGMLALTRWESKTNFGRPKFDPADAAALHVATVDGSCIGTWRTSVWLEGGHYRFEARVRTRGIVGDPGDPRAGAGVRPRTSPPQPGVVGDSEWREVGCELDVPDGLSEVGLVCEFRGMEGEAWFDRASLRLRRGPAPAPAR